MNNKITFAEIQKRFNDESYKTCDGEFAGIAYKQLEAFGKTINPMKKGYKDRIDSLHQSGVQITFDFGGKTYTVSDKNTSSYEFDIPESDLISLARKYASTLIKTEFDYATALKLFKGKGLPKELADHIVTSTQVSMSIGQAKASTKKSNTSAEEDEE